MSGTPGVSPGSTLGGGGGSTSGAAGTGATGSGKFQQSGHDDPPGPTHVFLQQVLVC
jgi:hypothetical protein